ncbi:MAG: NADH-quinone oxidoreductase subunit N [Dysgonamonadaceae bacterium]|jgi:NADH-quinone oxidoreductase subunit N|nr:NADH-quinone oxidoreductase subunit N [Dysgonamonadaceae bacterium]
MNYSQVLLMRPELSLIALVVFFLLYDLIAGEKGRKYYHLVVSIGLVAHIVYNLFPTGDVSISEGMYVSSPMLGIVKTILTFGTLIVVLQSDLWLKRADTAIRRGEFYVITLFTLLGMFYMISSGHFLLFFIGLEMASVPMSCLVAFNKYNHESMEAAAKYVLSALFSSGLMMFGISFIYGLNGSLYFNDLLQTISASPAQIMALVFFTAGLGFKLSLVPFHLWTADVYEGAPTNVTGYLSVVSKGAVAFVTLTILLKVFVPLLDEWQQMLWWLIVASITIANLFAIRQKNIKRFFAFSSISQAGYIMLAAVCATPVAMTSLVYYILVYMVANLAVFGIISVVEQRSNGKVGISDYDGFYKTNPKLAFVMTLALFSLAGIPPFAGFFSKIFVFWAAFEAGFLVLVFIALLNTIVSLYYYLLIVKAMYISPSDNPITAFKSDTYTRVGLVLCLIGVLGLGIVSSVFGFLDSVSFGI